MKSPFVILAAAFLLCHQVAADEHAGLHASHTNAPSGWLAGAHRGGVDDGDWSFESSEGVGATGRFIGDSSLIGGNINSNGKAFAIFANPPTGTPFYAARKNFAKPALTTGDTITFQVAVDFRNGLKGFNLRDTADNSVWTFNVGRVDGTNGGYYIRNGSSASGVAFDNGQRFGGYHANTVFTFTFIQRERTIDWSAVRSGGLSATVTGTAPIESGTMACVRFFISGTDAGGSPSNNLYFNHFTFQTAPRSDAPLTLGERRLPGTTPSSLLRFSDPLASAVSIRHRGDGFTQDFPLTKVSGVWEIDVSTIPLPPGWHDFKFLLDGVWESGANRWLWIDSAGKIAPPPAVNLTWHSDPTTTMVVRWHQQVGSPATLRYRISGSAAAWTDVAPSSSTPFPHTERMIHMVELSSLTPDTEYEMELADHAEIYRFRTMPTTLSEPLRFGVGGDVNIGAVPDAMTAAIAAQDPHFIVVGGDIAYADGQAANFWKWLRYLESWHRLARAPDGRLIPKVVAIGNHEVRNGYAKNHPDYDGTAAWRLRCAPYFYRCFGFPGTLGHGVLDFGDYLSLVILDTDHSTRTMDQTAWLQSVLDARRNRPHLIPIYHVPAWPSHRSFEDEFAVRVRQHWVPLFEQAGVHLAFEHHDHTYKLTRPLLAGQVHADGIVYAGDGLWGITPRPPDSSRWYLQPGSSSQYHVHLVTLTASGRTLRSVDHLGHFIGGSAPDHVLLTQPVDGIPATPANLTAARLRARSVRLTWQPVGNAVSYLVYRDGALLGTSGGAEYTDSGRTPGSSASYEIVAVNRSGISPATPGLLVTHPAESVPPFVLGGDEDGSGYLLASPGMTLHAALRGDDLYLATWTPAGGANDHFLFVSPHLASTAEVPAPWVKSGLTAHPAGAPYLASESTQPYIAWSHAPSTSTSFRAAAPGGRMEGVIDLVEAFGSLPATVFLAAAGWQTADGGALLSQAPAGNGDPHLDPEEFLEVPLESLRDSSGAGFFDRTDPTRGFRAGLELGTGFTIRWTVVPGKRYQVWRSPSLAEDSWEKVHPDPLTAPSGGLEMSLIDSAAAELHRAFYRVEVVED